MSNHSSFPDQDMLRHLLDAKSAEAKERTMTRIMESAPVGATGNFPKGKLTKADEGEISFLVGAKNDKVILQFGTPVAWMGMTPEQAVDLGEMLIQKAAKVGFLRPIKVTV
jgi:hypothetical protein